MTDNTPTDPLQRRHLNDRRRVPRGGRRPLDVPGRFPPVLLVESDDSVRRVCRRYLDQFGFQVEEAATASAALAIVEHSQPHAAILELTRRREDEFVARLKAHAIPCVVTVSTDAGVVPAHAAALLVKPFPLAEMLSEVRRVLRSADQSAPGADGAEAPPNQG